MKSCINTKIKILLTVFFTLFISLICSSSQQNLPDRDKEILSQAVKELVNGSYDEALYLFNTLLQIRIVNNGESSIQVANVLTNLGVTKSQLGLYDQAIDFYKRAVSIYTAAGDTALIKLASVQQNLAICFNEKGDFDQAEQYYENAGRIFQKLNISRSTNYEILLTNLAGLYLDNKNIPKAQETIERAFRYHTDKNFNFIKWNIKGLISLKKQDYIQSINIFNKAIAVGEKDIAIDFADKELVYLNIGMAYLEMEDFENSIANYQIAKTLIEKKNGNQGISYSSCLNDIGINYLRKKENESNLEIFLKQRKKNIELSLDYFQKAILAITPGFNIQDWHSNPEPEIAIDKTRLLDALKNKAEALYLLAQIEEKQENNEVFLKLMKLALATYDLSIKTIHLIRNGYQNQESRLFLAENEHPVYSEAVEVAVRLYESTGDRLYFEKGFEFSERSRTADFQSMLRELQAKEFSGLPDSLIQKETEIKGEIAAYGNFIFNEKNASVPDQKKINLWKDKVFKLTLSYQEMINVIEKRYPRYYQYKYADPIVTVQKVQQSLKRREAFVEFFINERRKSGTRELYTFVITDHESKVIRKPITKDFDKTIDHFLQFIKNGLVLNTRKADFIQYAKNAHELYTILLEPIIPYIRNFQLIIVPDDKLSYLPFDAFLSSAADTSKMDFRNLDYVVRHHAVSYTYSATLLYYYFQNNLKYTNKMGAFAPDYSNDSIVSGSSSEGFLPLPGAEAEVNGATTIIPGDQFQGKKATKQNFIKNAEKYDILHLAMHTILNDSLPLYSKMVFSPDDSGKNDRTLNTFEVYNLKLTSDMVVLSGCNTGSGKLQKGEGVMSLARAFLYAGCPSIIMTLWNIEDVSSSLMMIDFYRNIKNGFSKDEALRRAKINYINQADPMKAHPYYWLGYVSIGKQTPLFKSKVGYFVGLIIFVFLAIVLEKWYFKRKKRINRLK